MRNQIMARVLRAQKGFTLIELVLIVLIIGILAAVAIPKYVGMKQEATDGVARGVLGSLRSANAMLYAKNLAGGTNGAAYNATTIKDFATVEGDITLSVSGTVITAVISGTTYTFGLSTAPDLPTTAGIVSAATASW